MINILKRIVFNDKIQSIAMYLLIFLLVAGSCLVVNNPDYDIWSRLMMGAHVVNHHSVMYHDVVSYTRTHIWYDHEWLSSAFLYIILTKFGFPGASVLKILLCSLTLLFIGLNIRKHTEYKGYRLIYLTLCCLLFKYISFYAVLRCQNFSYAIYPLYLFLLERYRNNNNSKVIYFIPFIMLFWLNIHGASIFGMAVFFLYLIGEVIARKPFKKLLIIFIISCLIYLINPWDIDFIKFTWDAIFVDRSYIEEWHSSFLLPPIHLFFHLLLIIFFAFLFTLGEIKNRKNNIKFNWTKLFVLLLSCYMSLSHIKHNMLFVITAFVYLYPEFIFLVDYILNFTKKKNKIIITLNTIIAISIIVFSTISFKNHPIKSTWYSIPTSEFPVYPMQFLKDNGIKGNMLAPFYWSGLIAYKNYPDIKIYMDGRQEQVYDFQIFKDVMEFMLLLDEQTPKVLFNYKTDIVLLENNWPANRYFANQNIFKLVYRDPKFSIYLAPQVQKEKYTYPKTAPDFDINSIFIPNHDF